MPWPTCRRGGDSDRCAQATGLDYIVESSVGEFMLGSRAKRALDPSAIGHPPLEQVVASEATVEPMEDRDMALSSNGGQTSRDRALNFAVTNTFQAAATVAEAIAANWTPLRWKKAPTVVSTATAGMCSSPSMTPKMASDRARYSALLWMWRIPCPSPWGGSSVGLSRVRGDRERGSKGSKGEGGLLALELLTDQLVPT